VLPQEKHPSALAEFESVLEAASGKQIVMFLDYDGTLSPIVKDPDSAVMTEEVSEKARRAPPCMLLFPQQTKAKQSMLCFVGLSPTPTCLTTPFLVLAADEGSGKRRRRAFPDGNRQREVQRQGAFQLQPSPSCLLPPLPFFFVYVPFAFRGSYELQSLSLPSTYKPGTVNLDVTV
jgi:hypothetical protein